MFYKKINKNVRRKRNKLIICSPIQLNCQSVVNLFVLHRGKFHLNGILYYTANLSGRYRTFCKVINILLTYYHYYQLLRLVNLMINISMEKLLPANKIQSKLYLTKLSTQRSFLRNNEIFIQNRLYLTN